MNRILGLDIVRSIAILLVVSVHSTYVFSAEAKEFLQSWIPNIDGVSVFFVLSGYLIGGILFRTIDKTGLTIRDLGQFWIRRWFRTLPNYFLVLVILLAYGVVIYKKESQFSYRYLVFIQNLISPHPDFFPEAWCLSVEEWFYLLFPFLCYLGLKLHLNRRKVILAVTFAFLIVPFVLRLFAYATDYELAYWGNNYRNIVIFRVDSLMYGILGAYLQRYKTAVWIRMKYPGIILSVLLIMCLTAYAAFKGNLKFWPVCYENLESIAALSALPYFSRLGNIRSQRLAAVFTFISTISYSMYVLNLSIIQWRVIPAFLSITHLREMAAGHLGILSFALFWPFTLGSAYLLYRYFERPMMDLRDKINSHAEPDTVTNKKNVREGT